MTTGERIKAARKLANLTQDELGAKIGVKGSAIHKYEAGLVVNLKKDVIADLANALGVSPVYLLGYDSAPFTEAEMFTGLTDPRRKEALQDALRIRNIDEVTQEILDALQLCNEKQKRFILKTIYNMIEEGE